MNEPGRETTNEEPSKLSDAVVDTELAAGIQRGLEGRNGGDGHPVEEVFADSYQKFNIPPADHPELTPKERAAAFVALAERDRPDTPLLSDEAISRESIYGARG